MVDSSSLRMSGASVLRTSLVGALLVMRQHQRITQQLCDFSFHFLDNSCVLPIINWVYNIITVNNLVSFRFVCVRGVDKIVLACVWENVGT